MGGGTYFKDFTKTLFELFHKIILSQEIVKKENKTKEWRTKTAFRLFPEIKKNKIFIQKPPSVAVIL